MALTQGQRIGRYTLTRRLGDPNMGQVWVAASDNGETVALKCISEELRGNEDMVRRFWRECAFQMRLRHPHIVPVLDCIQQDGDLFLVMQYVAGGSLEDHLIASQGKPLSLEEAARISSDILNALDYAHQQGVVHRDVKPSNILLQDGRSFLTDFGVAKGLKSRPGAPGESAGTYPYMSPEQILADRPADQRSDVYGFGCVLYEMLTGRPPFPVDPHTPCSDEELRHMHLAAEPKPPRELNPEIPERLNRVMLTALAKRPEDRFPGCGSFALAIEGAVAVPVAHTAVAERAASQAASRETRLATPAPYFGGLVAVWALDLFLLSQVRTSDDRIAAGSIAAIGAAAVVLPLAYKAWSAIQDGEASITAARAIIGLFIPVFNLIWSWRVFPGFAREYNAYADRRGIGVKRERPAIYAAFAVTAWIAIAASQLPNLFTAIVSAEIFVIVPLMMFTLIGAINRLVGARAAAPQPEAELAAGAAQRSGI